MFRVDRQLFDLFMVGFGCSFLAAAEICVCFCRPVVFSVVSGTAVFVDLSELPSRNCLLSG